MSRTVATTTGYVASAGLVLVSTAAVYLSLWKLLGITWTAYSAMMFGAWLGHEGMQKPDPIRLVWGYGVSSGAMLTSACLFLIPPALAHHRTLGGLGIAIGLIAGFTLHTTGHRLTHRPEPLFDQIVTELTVHSVAAGLIIGMVYATMPSLGTVLGVAIVSHKGPAGFAVARRLGYLGRSFSVVQLPAAGVGLSGLAVGTLGLSAGEAWHGLVFGFAAGVFLHVAIDFIPQCEIGGEISEITDLGDDSHVLLDRLRHHAIASTTIGGSAVVAIWYLS